jgi:hypothetical protein
MWCTELLILAPKWEPLRVTEIGDIQVWRSAKGLKLPR